MTKQKNVNVRLSTPYDHSRGNGVWAAEVRAVRTARPCTDCGQMIHRGQRAYRTNGFSSKMVCGPCGDGRRTGETR